jgi:hypothetical protein
VLDLVRCWAATFRRISSPTPTPHACTNNRRHGHGSSNTLPSASAAPAPPPGADEHLKCIYIYPKPSPARCCPTHPWPHASPRHLRTFLPCDAARTHSKRRSHPHHQPGRWPHLRPARRLPTHQPFLASRGSGPGDLISARRCLWHAFRPADGPSPRGVVPGLLVGAAVVQAGGPCAGVVIGGIR